MQSILIPTDFTSISDTASETAIKLAKKLGYDLVYMHMIQATPQDIINQGERKDFGKKVFDEVSEKNQKMDKYLKEASKESVNAEAILNYDRSYSTLLQYAEEHHISMIIMGTHGSRGIREVFKGSNSQMVSRLSSVPVLVVKEGYVHKSLKHIVFLSDFQEHPGEGYKNVVQLARKAEMRLHLVYINTPGHFTKHKDLHSKMNDYVKGHSDVIESQELFNAYDIEQGIEEYCDLHEVDIVSMVTHHREGTSSLFHSSLTEKLVNHLKLPVLSLHD